MNKIMVILMASQFFAMKNSMNMIIMIILACMFMSIFMFSLSVTHWFSVLAILIYVSGIMVLFMFIVSLAPNEKNKVKMQNNKYFIIAALLTSTNSSKTSAFSETLKINSSMGWNLMAFATIMVIIFVMAYFPPKLLKSLCKGMKTSK